MGYTYVLSDVHGQRACFEAILSKINLQPDDRLYVLGDVVERGADGIALLRRIMAMPNAKMLLGSQEFMMLNALDEPYDGIKRNTLDSVKLWWFDYKGLDTHQAFVGLPHSEIVDMLEYLKALPLNIDVEAGSRQFRLVYAADVDFYYRHKSQYTSKAEYSVWERNALREMSETGRNYVFGHTEPFILSPDLSSGVWHKEKLVEIESGCTLSDGSSDTEIGVIGERLVCVRLDDMKVYYSDGNSERKRES